MNTITEKYEFELYLEGVKVPFSAASISSNNSGISATISLALNKEIREIKANTLVHLFAKKYNGSWFLLFDGYVVGYSIFTGHSSRTMNLRCKDISHNLDIMWKFYTNQQNAFETHQKIIRHFGAPLDHKIVFTRPSKETKRQGIITKSKSVTQLLDQMVSDVIKNNLYFKKLEYASKFTNRFYYMDDPQVTEILDIELFQSIASRSPFSGLQTTRSIMDYFLNLINYNISYLSSPSYIKGKLDQIIYKPDNFIIPAPLCNVVLPDMISGITFNREFMAEPTRLALRADPVLGQSASSSDILQYLAYAPYELKQIEDKSSNYLYYDLINDENYRGIYPVLETTSQSVRMQGVNTSNINKQESNSRFAALKYSADYLLRKRQTAARTFNSSVCTFNPNLVLNFPGVVISEPIIIMGIINSINHNINSEGSISTTFSMSNCRVSDLEISKQNKEIIENLYKNVKFDWDSRSMNGNQINKARLLGEDDAAYPSWLSSNYLPSKIDSVYSDMLNCKSIMSILGNNNSTTKIENCRKLHENYLLYKNKNSGNLFIDSILGRNIVSKKEFFEDFLLLETLDNGETYIDSGGMVKQYSYIKDEHKKVILNYKKRINEGVGVF